MNTQHLEIINISIMNEAKELMGDRFVTMVEYFIEDSEGYLAEIEAGIKAKDEQALIPPSHTVKSSAKQIGAERVSEVAKNIESFCREFDKSDPSSFLKLEDLAWQLKEELSMSNNEFKKLL